MKLIVIPVAIIGRTVLRIVKYSFAVHLVLFERPFIVSSVLKNKFSSSMFFTLESGSLVSTAILVCFDNVFKVVLVFLHQVFDWRLFLSSSPLGKVIEIVFLES